MVERTERDTLTDTHTDRQTHTQRDRERERENTKGQSMTYRKPTKKTYKLSRRKIHTRATASCVQFRPCIDIHQGKVKQIVGSTLKDKDSDAGEGEDTKPTTNFVSDRGAAHYASLYRECKLRGGHVILLDSQEEATRAAAFEALSTYRDGMQVGGGVDASNARMWIERGASHVIVTSFAFTDGALNRDALRALVDKVGRSRIVLDLSCRMRDAEYFVVTDRWQKFSSFSLRPAAVAELADYCDEFLVHGVDVEGKKLGVDETLIRILGDISPIPVTYAGGVRAMEDLELVKSAGGGRVDVTVGSALDIFGGTLRFDDVVAWHRGNS